MKRTSLGLLGLLLLAIPTLAQEPFEGETLVSHLNSSESYMVDIEGNVVKTWNGSGDPAHLAYLLSDDTILRPCVDPDNQFPANGGGGRIQMIDSDDVIVWDYYFSNYDHLQHHDLEPMPNGNILILAWERKTHEEAIEAGRQSLVDELWPTLIVEVEPNGPTGGNIIWEWHLWDHLIQDADSTKANFGVVADHPELVDINQGSAPGGDWLHCNAIDYDHIYDQIVFSSNSLREFYVIDHSTTTEQAAGHGGGMSGQGGDILYRWGNPIMYDRGTEADQVFWGVHGVRWIDSGYPGAGNILVMNNGNRPGGVEDYSTVLELVPPRVGYNYLIEPDEPFGPEEPIWLYEDPGTFYTFRIGGAYRMPNGNTVICEGTEGFLFEVTESGTIVWDYSTAYQVHRAPRYWVDPADVPESPMCRVRLWPTSPNPFHAETAIQFDLHEPGQAELQVFDLEGSLVSTLVAGELTAGRHGTMWRGRDQTGRLVSSGVYLYRLSAPGLVQTRQMTLIR